MASSYERPLATDARGAFVAVADLRTAQSHKEQAPHKEELLLKDDLSASIESGIIRRDRMYVKQFLVTSVPLWIADQFALIASLLISTFAVAKLHSETPIDWFTWFVGLSAAGTFAFWIFGLYPGVGISADAEIRCSTLCVLLVFTVAGIAHASWVGIETASTLVFVYGGGQNLIFMPILRRQIRSIVGRTSWWGQPILVFGGGQSGGRVFQTLLNSPETGLRPIGIVDDLPNYWRDQHLNPDWYLGPWSEAAELIESHQVFCGVVPLEEGAEVDLGRRLTQLGGILPHVIVTFEGWSPLAQHTSGGSPLAGIPAMRIDQRLLMPIHKWMKFALDALLVIAVGILVFPAIAVLASLIYLTSRGPIFFCHERVGARGTRFKMWKFRSMVVNAEQVLQEHLKRDPALQAEWHKYHKLRRDPRITWIGKILRKTSLDELPQIWNIIRGEMSFVGPRPYPLYEFDDMRRTAPMIMRVRPGITGMWQISGRSRSTFEKRLRIDAQYVRDWSPWLDLYILSRTARVVATAEGAY